MSRQADSDRVEAREEGDVKGRYEVAAGDEGVPGSGRREAEDEVLLDALAAGLSYESAGALGGVSARTVRRRVSDVGFAAEVARRRSARVELITGRLTGLCERALQVLENCLDSDRPGDQLRAAEMVLTMTRRFRADSDVHARLAALEATPSEGSAGVEQRA